jgi:hypothetical protein
MIFSTMSRAAIGAGGAAGLIARKLAPEFAQGRPRSET